MGKLKDSLIRLQESAAIDSPKKKQSKKDTINGNKPSVAAAADDEDDILADEEAAVIELLKEELQSLNEKSTLSKKESRRLAKLEKLIEEAEEDDEEDDYELAFDTTKLTESASESESEIENGNVDEEDEDEDEDDEEVEEDEDEDQNDDDEDEEDVALSDVELDDDADVVPYQKTTINNVAALKQSLASISLLHSQLPFVEHLSITTEDPIVLKDVYDDLERELAFYKQGLSASNIARKNFKKDKTPFARPTDYFAEMVKSDEHMDKLKQKLIEEETAKKAAQEARRQRELKKFGKKVQHAKLQERQKDKRETLEKIKSLKRKRGGNEITTEDFDIAIEEDADKGSSRKERYGPNAKRQAKDSKYGHGGKKRFSRSNDADSSADISSFSNKNRSSSGRGGKRLGKSKRTARR